MDAMHIMVAVLYRHNGAGKTTTIAMLSGMATIDGGDAFILGHSMKKEKEQAKKLISFCPQENAFFEELTCIEHLAFFAALRGIDVTKAFEQSQEESFFNDLIAQKRFLMEQRSKIVDAIVLLKGHTLLEHQHGIVEMEKHFQRFGLSLFVDSGVKYEGRTVVAVANSWDGILLAVEKAGLTQKMFVSPRMLSGGMKRRLWLITSLIGNPKVLFIDEPTSGVDSGSRQVCRH